MNFIRKAAYGAVLSTVWVNGAWARDLDPTATAGVSDGLWVLLGLLAIAITRSGSKASPRGRILLLPRVQQEQGGPDEVGIVATSRASSARSLHLVNSTQTCIFFVAIASTVVEKGASCTQPSPSCVDMMDSAQTEQPLRCW